MAFEHVSLVFNATWSCVIYRSPVRPDHMTLSIGASGADDSLTVAENVGYRLTEEVQMLPELRCATDADLKTFLPDWLRPLIP